MIEKNIKNISALFLVFHPSSFIRLPLAWISVFLIFSIIPCCFWPNYSLTIIWINFIIKKLNQEFILIFAKWTAPGVIIIPISLLVFIFINNFIGLIPYIFTRTSHLVFRASLAIPLWLGHIVFKIYTSSLTSSSTFLSFILMFSPGMASSDSSSSHHKVNTSVVIYTKRIENLTSHDPLK